MHAPDRAAVTARRAARAAGLDALHPLLFAAYPVLFLWSQNLGETDPAELIAPLVVLVAAAAVATWLAGRLLGDARRGALAVSPLVVGLLVYGHVAGIVRPFGIPGFVQQAGWVALVVAAGIAAARLPSSRLAGPSRLLTRFAAVLVAITLVVIVPFQAAGLGRAGAVAGGDLATSTTAPKRDVYWLIFDRYGSDRAHRLMFGLENDLTPWLRERGFTVLDDSHANYVRTIASLSATTSMQHLADMAGLPPHGTRDQSFLATRLRSSLVARQFQALGYRYVQVGSWWSPTRDSAVADEMLRYGGQSEFAATLIEKSAVPAIARRLHVDLVDIRRRHYDSNQYGLAALEGVRDEPGPKFVFGHVLLPHLPTVFDRDGRYIPQAEERTIAVPDRYARQLAYANERLRGILDGLLALPESERPIIILQADEGPESPAYRAGRETWDWTTVPENEVEIKFGIMNAWYLPGGEDLHLDPTLTSINTFPTLFREYFGLDYENLPDRIFGAANYELPYDLIDITDRVPSLR